MIAEPEKPKPQTQRLAFKPRPQTPPIPNKKPGERGPETLGPTGPHLRAPFAPLPPLLGPHLLILGVVGVVVVVGLDYPGRPPCARPPAGPPPSDRPAGPLRRAARRTAPNFALFLSLGVFSLIFWWCLKRWDLKCARLGSWAVV